MFRTAFLLTAIVGLSAIRADETKIKPSKYTTDADFVTQAASGHMLESQLGEVAARRVKNDEVKKAAQHAAADHRKAFAELKAAAEKGGIQLPKELTKDHQKCLEKHLDEKANFDKVYLDEAVKGHEMAIAGYKAAATEAKDAGLREYAVKYLPALEEHWNTAKKLKETVK